MGKREKEAKKRKEKKGQKRTNTNKLEGSDGMNARRGD